MFRNIISPIQAWLLSQGKCVGCGLPLSRATREKHLEGLDKVTRKCKRIYIYDTKLNKYRRALIKEV